MAQRVIFGCDGSCRAGRLATGQLLQAEEARERHRDVVEPVADAEAPARLALFVHHERHVFPRVVRALERRVVAVVRRQNQDVALHIWDMKMTLIYALRKTLVKMLESIRMGKSHYTRNRLQSDCQKVYKCN